MIVAVVLAAGLSIRMGVPKMLLQWGDGTVIEKVVDTIQKAGITDVVVVSGALHSAIESKLETRHVTVVFNPDYANGEMTRSMQVGLSALPEKYEAALVALGDQPFLSELTIQEMLHAFRHTNKNIIIPSINNRRGHPWIIRKSLWNQIRLLKTPETMRDFMQSNQADIHYVLVDDENILKDMDTPEEYEHIKPKKS